MTKNATNAKPSPRWRVDLYVFTHWESTGKDSPPVRHLQPARQDYVHAVSPAKAIQSVLNAVDAHVRANVARVEVERATRQP